MISWDGYSIDIPNPPAEDLPYYFQQYTQFQPDQSAILAACSGTGPWNTTGTGSATADSDLSQETLNILEDCGGPDFEVTWEGTSFLSNGYSEADFYLGFPGGDNFFQPVLGANQPLITAESRTGLSCCSP
jgi:hypothetical protein